LRLAQVAKVTQKPVIVTFLSSTSL